MRQAMPRVSQIDVTALRETANSYFGLLGQATHSRTDRERLAKVILRRGRAVNRALTKTYQRGTQ